MSGARVVSARLEQQALDEWATAVTVVRGRLARIDRGESWAPPSVVRCLRVFAGPERSR